MIWRLNEMAKKKKKEKSTFDLYKSIRGSWNGVNPVTRIVESKKKKKPKYKHKQFEEQ
jgi:hypothetical protein